MEQYAGRMLGEECAFGKGEEHGRASTAGRKYVDAGMRTCNADLLIGQDPLRGLVTADCTACNAK